MKEFKAILLFLLLAVTGAIHAQTEDWLWAKKAGGASYDIGYNISTDTSGNSYVTGSFSGTANFGSTSLTSSGVSDIFVAKLDASGDYLWARRVGGSSGDSGLGISTDASGNCYVTGYFQGIASFGSTSLGSSGTTDVFIAKIDTNGNWLWARRAGGSSGDSGYGISIDANGNNYVTGNYSGSASFGSTTLTSSGTSDVFVAKLDSSGNWLWAMRAGGTSEDSGYGISIDANSNIYVTGYFTGTASFGSIFLTSSGEWDVFVAKLDSSGNWLWACQTGCNYGYGQDLSTDPSGNSYVTGRFQGTASFGSTSLTSSGEWDVFVAKLDSSGNWLWAKQAGGTSEDSGYGISIDASGNCYVTGRFQGTASFGGTSLISSGGSDIFAAKLNTNGNWLWATRAGGTSTEYSNGISSDTSGNCYVTGGFFSSASFCGTSLTSSGSADVFVAKVGTPIYQVIAPNGEEHWQAGSTQTVYWHAINSVNHVNIQLSVNNGETWIMLNANPEAVNLGRFAFTVPFVSSNQCLIRVGDATNGAWYDVSDAPFSISSSPPAALFLTAPVSARLQTGRSYAVTWIATGVSSVNLEYSTDGGLSWQNITSGIPANLGTYNWSVPEVSAPSCYLRVSDAANAVVYDWSDNPFSICTLLLMSPNGGEFYQSGWVRNISWQAEQIANVKLEYCVNDGATWQTIIASCSASTASYAWTVPAVSSNQYLVRISDAADSSISDQSDAGFTICYLALTYPSATGIKVLAGRTYNINWSAQLLPETIALELTTNGTTYTTIATGIDATLQSYLWTVPDTPSTTCRVRIVSEYSSQVTSTSGNAFTICRLRVLVPNGTEIWGAQSTKAISWSASNVSNLKLEYTSNDGASWQLIAASVTASSGSYNWTLPAINSTQCRVRITDTTDNTIWDTSDNTFSIRPQIIITAPNGNEFLTTGNMYSIFWSSTAEVSFVLIDYSINGGTSWLPIQSSNYPASVGRYDWIVPNNPSANCLVRVRKHDNSAIFDVSDAAFTITANPVPPVAQFSADVTSGLEPLSVQFSDNSTSGTGNITSWLWQFGTGDSSTLQNPLYVYNSPGFYSVTLTVTNAAGLSNSLTIEDYITVLPRFPVIATNPENRLDFGNVYLGSSSVPQPLWIRNIGTAALYVDALSYLLDSSPFAVQERSLPFSISEGDSLCVHLVFTPQAAGTVTDSLYIHSNAQNRPVYALGLRGSGEYVPPKPPTGVETAMLGYDMHISWDAVTETIFDTPITPDGYLVFYNGSEDPDGEFYFHGFSPGLSYIHYYVGRYAQHMFYRVRAVKHYGTRAFDPDSLVRGMSEKEVLELLQVR